MTELSFVTQGEKGKAKTKASMFHWDGASASMYKQGDKVLTWSEVGDLIADRMRKAGLSFNSVSAGLHMIPKYVWDLEGRIEQLDQENMQLRAQVESLTEQLTEKKARK